MFFLRAAFWLSTLVLLLPPSQDGEPAPRLNVLHAAYAARILIQDVSGVCDRHPEACATSREALTHLSRKLATGAQIVSAGIAAGQSGARTEPELPGTLNPSDLEPEWGASKTPI
jgi:hypothetical protein